MYKRRPKCRLRCRFPYNCVLHPHLPFPPFLLPCVTTHHSVESLSPLPCQYLNRILRKETPSHHCQMWTPLCIPSAHRLCLTQPFFCCMVYSHFFPLGPIFFLVSFPIFLCDLLYTNIGGL